MAVACGDNSIQSVGGSAGGAVTNGKKSIQNNSGLSASSKGDVSISCNEPEEQDKIKVTGTNLAPFYWIPGGGFAGFLSGATGSGGIQTMPNNSQQDEDTTYCGAADGARMAHAKADIALKLNTLEVGDVVEIEYNNGQTELFIIDCIICSIPGLPIPGTCG